MKRTIHRFAALAAISTIALAGCAGADSGSSGDAGSSDQSPRQESAESTPQADEESDGDEGSGSSGSSGQDSSSQKSNAAKDPAGTHIARTAGLTVAVKDIEQASATVRSAATGAGGYVSSEETRITDGEGSSRSSSSSSSGDITPPTGTGPWAQIVVTVPVDELDSTITELAKVGTVTQRTSDAEDLSKQYTDTTARVRSMKKSVARLRALIDDTEDLEQIVTLEDELAQREANLESMVSQQKSLEKRTTTAPITVSLVTPEAAEDDAEESDETGFVAGLKGGWDSFTTALDAGLTALGAVTPFAVTGLVFLAPVAWWLRRRTRNRSLSAR